MKKETFLNLIGIFFMKVGVFNNAGFASVTMTECLILVFGGYNLIFNSGLILRFHQFVYEVKYETKSVMSVLEDKDGASAWKNEVVNGLIAFLVALGHSLTKLGLRIHSSTEFHCLFLGAISTAAAGILAMEIGLLSRSEPRLITNLSTRINRDVSLRFPR